LFAQKPVLELPAALVEELLEKNEKVGGCIRPTPMSPRANSRNKRLNGERYRRSLQMQRERYASDPEYRERRCRHAREWQAENPERVMMCRRRRAGRAGKGSAPS